jgi:Papain family cysteine protease
LRLQGSGVGVLPCAARIAPVLAHFKVTVWDLWMPEILVWCVCVSSNKSKHPDTRNGVSTSWESVVYEECHGDQEMRCRMCMSIKQFSAHVAGEEPMKAEIFANGPIACGIDANDKDFAYGYHGGIFVPKKQPVKIDHYVEVHRLASAAGSSRGFAFWGVP